MIERIEPLPPVPEALRTAALQRRIVPFVGAGVSQLGGCPGWDEFANAALVQLVRNGYFTHAQRDQVSHLTARVKLSIALEVARQHDAAIDFKAILLPRDSDRKRVGDEAYGHLSRLSTTFVTTNYDDWLDWMPPAQVGSVDSSDPSRERQTERRRFCRHEDINCLNLDAKDAVFHIHGSVHDPDSMVLTTIHYLERYASHEIDGDRRGENPLLTFLRTLFRLKSVLFLGYGLNELEVLEFVIQKGTLNRPNSGEEPQHYVVQGFFSHELELARNMERYFQQFGIGLLPFSRDGQDWGQLADVIAYLARVIPPGDVTGLPMRREMEELLS